MSFETIILIGVGGLSVILYGWYVSLVGRKNKAFEALSSIDVQLRKRHDLLPNVLAIAKQFMEHEKDLMERLTAMRARLPDRLDTSNSEALAAQLVSEGEFTGLLGKFFAVAENYPELRSSDNLLAAQQTFEEVEGHVAAARRFYNSAVVDLNNAIQIWPGSVIAARAGIKEMPFFEDLEPAAREPVDATELLR